MMFAARHTDQAKWVRTLMGVAAPLALSLTLLLPHATATDWRAWAALGLAALLYGSCGLSQRLEARLASSSGVLVAALIGLLVAGTGGAGSDYQDVFIIPLVFTAATHAPRDMLRDMAATVAMGALPAAYDAAQNDWFLADFLTDLLIWTAAVALVRLLSVRLTSSEEAFEALRLGVESLDDAVAILDLAHGRVLYANPAAHHLAPHGIADDVAVALTGQTVQELAAAVEHDGTCRTATVDGHGVHRETTVSHTHALDRACLVLISRDATHHHEAERATSAARERERAAARELARTARSQRVFLRSVSHELRTPLTAALGFTTMIEERGEDLDPDELHSFATRARQATSRLAQLVEGVTEYAQLTGSGPRPTRTVTELSTLVQRAVDEASGPLPPVELQVGSHPAPVAACPEQIGRLVRSLLDNVRRHTPEGTTAIVRIEMSGESVDLAVEDDGPGLPPGWETAVFQPFTQGPGVDSDPSPGIGLGLALVAEYAIQHDGRAWIEERQGGGTRVVVRFPVARTVEVRTAGVR